VSFPQYPKYKDSYVEWLGEVPEHWGVTALKRGFTVALGKMLQPESTSPDEELLPYLRAANIQWGGVDTTDIKQMWLSRRDRTQLRLERGDLLVSEGGDVGRSCLWAAELDDCYFQNSVNRIRSRDGHSNRYLYYWLSTIKDKGYIDVLCNKSTIAHFTAEKVAAVPVTFPPPTEQADIAAFLDQETAKIDELVAEQQRLIELLKEKRQAIISYAVTKGMNTSANLKPSGIEWLGDLPAHWKVVSLKHLVSRPIIDGPHETPTKCDEGIPFVSAESVSQGVINFDKMWGYISPEDHAKFSKRYKPKRGDVLIVKVGATTGIPAIVETDEDFNIWVPLAAIRLRVEIEPRFILHVLRSNNLKTAYELSWTYGTQQTLGLGTISSLRIPVPPKEEQLEIVKYLDSILPLLESLSSEAQYAIDLLQERRSALISATVTGQIDVRPLLGKEAA
jgi:type I restriction enzyme S subunit